MSVVLLGCVPSQENAAERLLERAVAAESSCLAVVRGDKTVVSSRKESDEPLRAFSITKSVTALLIGIAQDDGLVDIFEPVARYVPDWQGTASAAVSIRNVLTNTSGREWDARTDYRDMAVQAPDKTAFAIGLGHDAEPGTTWVYNNSAIQVLEAVLEPATGIPVDEFAEANLFLPLGMHDTTIERDDAGNANVFAGLSTTCSDLVRLGTMVLNGGNTPDGRRLISQEFLDQAVGAPSTSLNSAYGLLWWLNQPGAAVTPNVAMTGRGGNVEGPLVPDAPRSTAWALRLNNQILMIVPPLDAVAVRLGKKPPTGSGFTLTAFTEDVLRVLSEE